MPRRYTRTAVRKPAQGLWPMRAEPGPSFRWGIVTRRSQLNRDGTEGSTRRQELAVHNHLSQNRMGRVVAVYSDIASAYDERAKRPEFENALIDLQAGRIDGLACWKVDRLVRRTNQYRRVLDVLEKSGGRLFSLSEGIDTAAEGVAKVITNIVLSILVALAEMESDSTSARLVLMHQERARQGRPHRTSKRPWGRTDDWTGVVPQEVALIQEACQRVLAGEGVAAITADWRSRGVLTVMGKRWRPEYLKDALLSRHLIAEREYEGSVIPLEGVPPLLEREAWERMQARLGSAASLPKGPTVSRLLSGIMLCGGCGHPVSGNTATSGTPRYACRKRPSHENACGGSGALCAPVDAIVGTEMVKLLNDRERVGALLRQHASSPELEALHERQRELNESLLALDQALKPPPGKPRLPLDRYWSLVEEIEAERDELNRRLAGTREAALLAETLSVDWDLDEWQGRPLDWKRTVIGLTIARIELEPRGKIGARDAHGRNTFDPSRVVVKFA
jgi:site-specific DNA recombinase